MGTYKRLPREKEKPSNELATGLEKLYHWLEYNWRGVLTGIFTMLIIAAAFLLISMYSGGKSEKARDLLFKAEKAAQGTDEAIGLFNDVLKEYPSSKSASIARLKLADIYFTKKDYAKATEYLTPLQDDSDAPIRILAMHNLAANKLAMNQPKEAADVYLKAYKDKKNPARGVSYFNAALAYEQAGNVDDAKKAYEELAKEDTTFSNPDLREKSKEKLIWLAIGGK